MPPLILQNGLPIIVAYSDALFPRALAVGDETKISYPSSSFSDSLPEGSRGKWLLKSKEKRRLLSPLVCHRQENRRC